MPVHKLLEAARPFKLRACICVRETAPPSLQLQLAKLAAGDQRRLPHKSEAVYVPKSVGQGTGNE
jgi:hypothetical protein